MAVRWSLAALALTVMVTAPAAAQNRQQRMGPPPGAGSRQAEQLLERFSQRAAQALDLSEEAASGVSEVLQRFRLERETLGVRRQALRQELALVVRRTPDDEQRVSELLDELLEVQVRAAQLDVGEQRELAEFLTPMQRARLLYLRERLAQQAMERQRQRGRVPPGRGVQPAPRGQQPPGGRPLPL